MRFEVPQFIDVEDKIFGPLSFTQFLYLVGGGGLAFLLIRFVPGIGFLLAIGAIIFAIMLAFYTKNSRTFVQILEAWAKYQIGGKLFLWRKEDKKSKLTIDRKEITKAEEKEPEMYVDAVKIKDLASSLDILDKEARTGIYAIKREDISSPGNSTKEIGQEIK